MYIWKCWRDSRGAFLVFLILICVWGLAGTAILANIGGWTSRRATPVIWYEFAHILIATQVVFAFFSAFALGASTLGDDHAKGALPFLLTRPRSRASMCWQSWLVGAVALEILVLIALGWFRFTPGFARFPRHPDSPVYSDRALLMILITLFLYSLTFFFTLLLKNGRYGAGMVLLLVIAYMTVGILLTVSFDFGLPYVPGPRPRAFQGPLWPEISIWLSASFLLATGSQLVFARQEV